MFLELRLADHVYFFSDAILPYNSTIARLLTSKDQVKVCSQVLAPLALKELTLLYSNSSGTALSVAIICIIVSWQIKRKKITDLCKDFFSPKHNVQ